MIAALIAALLVVVPAPTRGDSDVPMVYVDGWNLLGPGTAEYPAYWDYAPPREHQGGTVPAGMYVEVRWGGTCTIDGVTHYSSLLHHAFCYGRGGA